MQRGAATRRFRQRGSGLGFFKLDAKSLEFAAVKLKRLVVKPPLFCSRQLSLDEFVIAFFTNGPSSPTLPIVIYSMVRFGVTPEINALATLLVAVSFTAVILAQRSSRLTDAV